MKQLAAMVGASALCLAMSVVPGTALATPPLQVFNISSSPVSEYGKSTPIAGNPAYGYVFVDEEGWYNFIIQAPNNTYPARDGRDFNIQYGQQLVNLHTAKTPLSEYAHIKAEDIEVTTDSMIVPGSAWDQRMGRGIVARHKFVLGEADSSGRKPPPVAMWDLVRDDSPGQFPVFALIIAPKGLLNVVCVSKVSHASCHNVIRMALRMDAGAY